MQKCIYHTFKYQVNSSTGVLYLIKLGPTQGVDPTVHYREPLLKPGQHYTISNSGTYIFFSSLTAQLSLQQALNLGVQVSYNGLNLLN